MFKPVSTNWLLDGKPVAPQDAGMNENWLSMWTARFARWAARLAAAAVRPSQGDEMWDRRGVWPDLDDADYRRAMQDLEAVRVRFPDHA
jgi:hypothetical protein